MWRQQSALAQAAFASSHPGLASQLTEAGNKVGPRLCEQNGMQESDPGSSPWAWPTVSDSEDLTNGLNCFIGRVNTGTPIRQGPE